MLDQSTGPVFLVIGMLGLPVAIAAMLLLFAAVTGNHTPFLWFYSKLSGTKFPADKE